MPLDCAICKECRVFTAAAFEWHGSRAGPLPGPDYSTSARNTPTLAPRLLLSFMLSESAAHVWLCGPPLDRAMECATVRPASVHRDWAWTLFSAWFG
jgi:hypothetical protein